MDAAGSLHEESEIVSQVLVNSSLVGHDSHGILRLPSYVNLVKAGEVRPGAPFEIERETRAMAVVNGHQGWGPVIARKAMQIAIEKARECSVGNVDILNPVQISAEEPCVNNLPISLLGVALAE